VAVDAVRAERSKPVRAQKLKPIENSPSSDRTVPRTNAPFTSSQARGALQLEHGAPSRVGSGSSTPKMSRFAEKLRSGGVAINVVRPALVTFYTLLNDEQKARFNLMAPPPAKASDACTPWVARAHRSVGRMIA
jgi:hypothetical protein